MTTNTGKDRAVSSSRLSALDDSGELDVDTIQFPSLADREVSQLKHHSPEKDAKGSPDSQTTSSSKQTSSDKLSALPTSTSNPNITRLLRSPNATSSSILPGRGHRRSLDASVSLPSFATADFDSPPMGNAWNTTQNLATHLGGTASRGAVSSESSLEKDTPKQRVSFESDRGSVPTKQSIRHAFSRIQRGSDPPFPSPALRSSAYRDSQKDPESSNLGSRSPSQSRSRAASPLRIFQQWSGRHRHRLPAEEPFVPIDPFKFKTHFRFPYLSSLHDSLHKHEGLSSPDIQTCQACVPSSSMRAFWGNARIFITDTLPRQVYLHILLRLPAMYFTRVAKIFEDAEVSRPDIQRMIESGGGGSAFLFSSASEPVTVGTVESSAAPPGTLSPTMAAGIGLTAQVGVAPSSVPQMPLPYPDDWTPPLVSPALIRFKHSWEAFIDSLVREWKTLNVVSALLLSAILTMFQIPSAADDPVTRTAALLSLICALMSLSYGCMYIVRFGTMRSMYRASKWAEEARKTKTSIWWNVWVLLAMPAVWMSWSMLLFIASILSFVWRTGSELDPEQRPPLSAHAALGPRIAVTVVFGLGMVFFAMIVRTLRSYGMHNVSVQPRAGLRARDIDAAMERRGRERQRSTSGSTRRREEAAPERKARGVAVEVDEVKEGGGKDKGGLKGMLGLGLIGVGSREHDSGLHLDLEKGNSREL